MRLLGGLSGRGFERVELGVVLHGWMYGDVGGFCIVLYVYRVGVFVTTTGYRR